MLNWVSWLKRPKNMPLSHALLSERKVKIHGIIFHIRRLNPLDYLAGYQVVQQMFAVYAKPDAPKKELTESESEKIKTHYIDVFTAAVSSPKLSRKPPEPGQTDVLYVDALFRHWDICQQLYNEIWMFTYGKKKATSFGYLKSA